MEKSTLGEKMYKRELGLAQQISKKATFFLFGPRQTGKSYLLKHELPDALYIDLLHGPTRRILNKNPEKIEDMARSSINDQQHIIIIDEIQKIPELLDEVHRLIENDDYKNISFILTGSSSRKLRQSNANMLGGRAQRIYFFPLTWKEISSAEHFDFNKYLLVGGLPSIYSNHDWRDKIEAYVNIFLNEEIAQECKVRNIQGFERFLQTAAQYSGEMINYSNIASDAQLSESSVRNYFQILEDTLIGYRLPPWQSPIRKAITTEKFYFFDLGIKWALCNISQIPQKTPLFGVAFEHFIINEIRAYNSYRDKKAKIYFWRDYDKHEVDIIINGNIAIEIKGTENIQFKHTKDLKYLAQAATLEKKIIIALESIKRTDSNGIQVYPWETFMLDLWNDLIF